MKIHAAAGHAQIPLCPPRALGFLDHEVKNQMEKIQAKGSSTEVYRDVYALCNKRATPATEMRT